MTAVADLTEYKGKKIALVYNDAEANEAIELECTVEAVQPDILLVKPKGKSNLKMISVDSIEPGTIRLVEATDKPLKAKKVQPVVLGKAKSHLLERHGLTLEQANGMTEEQAFEYHASLDHVGLDLGHVHEAKASDDTAASE